MGDQEAITAHGDRPTLLTFSEGLVSINQDSIVVDLALFTEF